MSLKAWGFQDFRIFMRFLKTFLKRFRHRFVSPFRPKPFNDAHRPFCIIFNYWWPELFVRLRREAKVLVLFQHLLLIKICGISFFLS